MFLPVSPTFLRQVTQRFFFFLASLSSSLPSSWLLGPAQSALSSGSDFYNRKTNDSVSSIFSYSWCLLILSPKDLWHAAPFTRRWSFWRGRQASYMIFLQSFFHSAQRNSFSVIVVLVWVSVFAWSLRHGTNKRFTRCLMSYLKLICVTPGR